MILYMSMKFHENILNSFQVIEGTQNYHCQNSKGNNSKIVLIRVTFPVLSTLSDNALYFYEIIIVNIQREITPKMYRQELQFMFPVRRLLMF